MRALVADSLLEDVTLQAAYLIAMATLFAGGVLLFVTWLRH